MTLAFKAFAATRILPGMIVRCIGFSSLVTMRYAGRERHRLSPTMLRLSSGNIIVIFLVDFASMEAGARHLQIFTRAETRTRCNQMS